MSAGAATPAPISSAERAGARSGLKLLLAVCCVAQFLVILDLSIVNIAVPSIQTDLGFSSPDLQWVIDAYAIAFAGFLMLGGRVADHYGRRRIFVAALILFAAASLIGGVAPDQGTLIAGRALQGFAGALMAACSLAIITGSFAPGPELNRAIATWASMNGLGGAAGVLLGGIITEVLSWRWVLLINTPIALAGAVVAWRVVTERRRGRSTDSFDVAGAATLTIGQIVLVYGVVEGGLKGWGSSAALGPIALGLVLLVAFVVIETRFASAPLIPFKELPPALRMANNIVLLFSATLFPMWFISTLYMQQVLGIAPLHAGLNFLPMTLTILLIAPRAGKLVGRFGVRAVLGGGLTMMTAGLLLFGLINSSGSPVIYVVIPGVLTAAGIAMSIVPSTIAATQGAKEGQAGLASGLVNTSRQVGGGLGLALLITLATQHSTSLIGHGQQVAEAHTNGFRLAYLIGAGLAAAAALLTFVAMPRPAAEQRVADRRLGAVIVIAIACFAGAAAAFNGDHAAPLGRYGAGHSYSFVTAPALHPPKYRLFHQQPGTQLAPGYLLTANFLNLNEPPIIGQSGPLILDRSLQPVWFQPVPEKYVASNLSKQTWEGRPALSWWQGIVTNTGATEAGEYVLVDQHYRQIARLKATGGWVVTLHELIVDGEDAWVTANKNIALDLSKYGGAYNGAVIDSAVQEYNLRTGKLVRSWDALDHISLYDAQSTLPTNGFPWDAYHVNSIQLMPGGKSFLVSMRDTWAVYLVNIATGKVEWTLGGRHSSFELGSQSSFEWQHDARLAPDGTFTVFDDHCCQLTGGGTYVGAKAHSRGLVLKLDQAAHTASFVAQYGREEGFESQYMGDVQQLANGDVLVGWGSEHYFSEFSSSGKLLYEVELPGPDLTYRATVAQWEGKPLSPPLGAARGNTVYASWNGATAVAAWRVLAEPSAGRPEVLVARAARTGFETAIPVSASHQSFAVQALDASGHVLGVSRPFSAHA
ncbi:MAG: MFS transporter [Solirubrobacteraceae bacterium]